MYSLRPNLLFAFHGCDKTVRDQVVAGTIQLRDSVKDHEWLGHGLYFWENSESRALQYARQLAKAPRKNGPKIKTPAVLGAVINLGFCLDLLDYKNLGFVKESYKLLKGASDKAGFTLPENTAPKGSTDTLIRKLDCLVLNTVHQARENQGLEPFDSVRGIFLEGNAIYAGAGFREKDHIQVCVRNPNCIKAYFVPRTLSNSYNRV